MDRQEFLQFDKPEIRASSTGVKVQAGRVAMRGVLAIFAGVWIFTLTVVVVLVLLLVWIMH